MDRGFYRGIAILLLLFALMALGNSYGVWDSTPTRQKTRQDVIEEQNNKWARDVKADLCKQGYTNCK